MVSLSGIQLPLQPGGTTAPTQAGSNDAPVAAVSHPSAAAEHKAVSAEGDTVSISDHRHDATIVASYGPGTPSKSPVPVAVAASPGTIPAQRKMFPLAFGNLLANVERGPDFAYLRRMLYELRLKIMSRLDSNASK